MYTRPASLYPSRTLHRVNTRRASIHPPASSFTSPHTHPYTRALSLSSSCLPLVPALLHPHTYTNTHEHSLSPSHELSYIHTQTNKRTSSFVRTGALWHQDVTLIGKSTVVSESQERDTGEVHSAPEGTFGTRGTFGTVFRIFYFANKYYQNQVTISSSSSNHPSQPTTCHAQ